MKATELKTILEKHQAYLKGEPCGERAYLCGADLRGANLRGAILPDGSTPKPEVPA
jgi:uncharacterized protein YjbI with pentapeptide repeats